MNDPSVIKNAVLATAAALFGAASAALGGWDVLLQTLLFFITLDCITGLLVAGVFKRSKKTERGKLDSHAGFKGICKKGAELALVLIAVRLDALAGTGQFTRMAVIAFFIGNEGISLLENFGLMGVPYPAFLRNALDALREQGDKGSNET